jgi:hypothetical protein
MPSALYQVRVVSASFRVGVLAMLFETSCSVPRRHWILFSIKEHDR